MVEQTSLFSEVAEGWERKAVEPTRPEEARVRRPVRNQVQMVMEDLDATLPGRASGAGGLDFLDGLELKPSMHLSKRSRVGRADPASDPRYCWGFGYTPR